jgi:tryptophan synthase alpha chain
VTALGDMFAALRDRDEAALIAFVMAGHPDLATSEALLRTMVAAGADAVEVEIPFSDPLADGTTIQRASQHALARGVTLADALAMVGRLHASGVTVPLLLMGYYNPFLRYGLERLAEAAADRGVAGLVVPDLPPEETAELRAPLAARQIDLIGFAAPTSTDERLRRVADTAAGFVYCVSLTGTTGIRRELSTGLEGFLARVRAHTALPLAVGFGISTPDHVRRVAALADGAIVGSAIIDLIDRTPAPERETALTDFVRALKAATRRG